MAALTPEQIARQDAGLCIEGDCEAVAERFSKCSEHLPEWQRRLPQMTYTARPNRHAWGDDNSRRAARLRR